MLRLTLTRNDSNPRRYVRFIRYERVGDKVFPLGDTGNAIRQLRWSQIDRCEHADPAFERDWREHVRQSDRGETTAEHNERVWAEYVRSLQPEQRRAA